MWKIILSAVLSLFTAAWLTIVGMQVKKRIDRFLDDDDNWPGGCVVTP